MVIERLAAYYCDMETCGERIDRWCERIELIADYCDMET